MKLSEFKDEKAIEVIGALIEPITRICTDKKVQKLYNDKANAPKIISFLCKAHAKDVMECFAILEDVPIEEYHCNLITLPAKLMEIINDEDFMELFTFAETKKAD